MQPNPEHAPALAEHAWCREIFDSLNFKFKAPKVEPLFNPDKQPEWLQNVARELFQQIWPMVPMRKFGEITPEKLGRFLGQQCANCYAIGHAFEVGLQNLDRAQPVLKQFEAHRHLKPVASTLEVADLVRSLMADMVRTTSRFEKVVHRAFKKALDQPSHAAAVSFFSGFAKSLGRPGIVNLRPANATSATNVYLRLLFHWREVEKLRSVVELQEFLISNGMPKYQVGDIERLARLCSRVKLHLGKPGRPRKSNNSDTPAT